MKIQQLSKLASALEKHAGFTDYFFNLAIALEYEYKYSFGEVTLFPYIQKDTIIPTVIPAIILEFPQYNQMPTVLELCNFISQDTHKKPDHFPDIYLYYRYTAETLTIINTHTPGLTKG